MNRTYLDSISKAKSLYEGFDDVIHDLDHSERVAEYARKIADSINYKDKGFLTLCAFWHDAARIKNSEGHEERSALLAKEDLLSRGVDKQTAERVFDAIRFHKSSHNPITIEGKIIRDADKLDVTTIERWKKCAKAGWRQDYIEDIKLTASRIDKYPDIFTYKYAKDLAIQQAPQFMEYYESVKSGFGSI